jgi:hypothetical protein
MKNRIFALILFVTSFALGQNVEIIKSDIFKDKKKESYLAYALPDDKGGLVTIRSYYGGLFKTFKGYYIQYFDSQLNITKELDYKNERRRLRNAFVKNGKLHLIEYEHLKEEDRIVMYATTANLNDLEFSRKEILSFSEDNVKKYFGVMIFPFFIGNGWNQSDGDHFGTVTISNNKKYIAINFDFKNNEKETHKVFVFDTDFNEVYTNLIVRDIEDRLFRYRDVEIDDNDGSLYFLGKVYKNGSTRERKKGEINYYYQLSKINGKGEKIVNFETSDKFIGSMNLLINGTKLSCVGFYGKRDEERINGVCFFDINPKSLYIQNEKFNPFNDQFLSDKYGDRKRKKKRKQEKGIDNVDFKDVTILANGDIVINAEEFFITTSEFTSANGSDRTVTKYHYNDIMSIRMDKKGDLKWARNINKAQTIRGNASFTSMSTDEASYFLINCSDKIKKSKEGLLFFKQVPSKKSNLYMLKIDAKGEISYQKLIDRKESKVFYRVNGGLVNDEDRTIILLGKRKRNSRIIKVKI